MLTFTRNGPTTSALTVSYAVGGIATPGSDYSALGTSVTFAAGSATAVKMVAVIDDLEVEAPETVEVTVVAGTGYVVGSPTAATVTIADNDLPAVSVVATDAAAGEPSDGGTFMFTRSGPTTSALTVNCAVGGTATPGSDYSILGTSVTFAAGSATAVKMVTVTDDIEVEAAETVEVTVVAGAGYTVGSPSAATVTIADNEASMLDVALVTGKTLGAMQNSITAWMGMRIRVGGAPMVVTELGRIYLSGNSAAHELRLVQATTKAVVASAVWDPAGGVHGLFRYVRLSSPVTLAANTEYYLVSREIAGGDRWCNGATLVTTTAGAGVLGTAISAEGVTWTLGSVAGRAFVPTDLKYQGAGEVPMVSVVATDGAAGEPSDGGRFMFTRSGPTVSALTVDFTVGGTGTSGTDYSALGTSVTFAAGSATASLAVTVTDDSEVEAAETVDVTLVAGTGYVVGSPSTATVTIADNEVPCSTVAMVTGVTTLGTAMNSLSAWMGIRVKIGANPIQVSELGRIYLDGNVASHDLLLVQAASKAVVASVKWNPTGGMNRTFLYARLAPPVTLAANTEYYLVSSEVSGGDRWCNAATVLTTTAAASDLGTVLSADQVTWVLGSVTGRAFGPVDLKYSTCVGAGAGFGDVVGVSRAEGEALLPVLRVRLVPAQGGDSSSLGTLIGAPGRVSGVEFSRDLVTWVLVEGEAYRAGEHEVEVLEVPGTSAGFYRLRVEQGVGVDR
jgi:hypothetical protein